MSHPAKLILCVDDDEISLSVLAFTLRTNHYRVLTATNGPAAITLFAENDVDMVLTDHLMPNMDGASLVMKLKEIGPYIPMVILGDPQKMYGQVHSADVLLSKKRCSTLELLERVRIMSARKRGPRRQIRKPIAGVAAALAMLLFFALLPAFGGAQARYHHDGQAVLPDPEWTPGAIDPRLTTKKLCSPKFHTVSARDVDESTKVRICREYGITTGCPGPGFELDHLISIELGGSNDRKNLWPQFVDGRDTIGFHTKDRVENALHRMVCDGQLSLRDAQKGIAGDWYRFGIDEHIIGVGI